MKNSKIESLSWKTFFISLVFCLCGFQLWAGPGAGNTETSSLKFSFSHRVRFVTWDNAIHLDKDAGSAATFNRHRTSLGAVFAPGDRWEFALKLTNEFRIYYKPKGRTFNFNEVFFDNLYIKARPFSFPLTITAGRQNIMLGEGFVVMDGHPLDGSRSIYFNALRLDYRPAEGQSLTAFYTYQPQTDTWLPLLNDRQQALIEQPEEGIGLYYSGAFGVEGLETYIIRKNIRPSEIRPVRSSINTAGARMRFSLEQRTSLTAEAAYQGGSYGDAGRSAFGGYAHLDFMIPENSPLAGSLTLGGLFLSGDDPGTPEMEGWDPLFSRWPKWSESYIYTLIPEQGGRVAYWNNLSSIYSTVNLNLAASVGTSLTYHRLHAHRRQSASGMFGAGRIRGDLFIFILNLKFHSSLSGHIRWERFIPGNYYFPKADRYHWLRLELMYRF